MPRGSPDWGFLAPQKSLMQLLREQNHFYANVSTAAGGAGKYTRHQLWNPVGSLVDAFVVSYGFEAGLAGKAVLAFSLTALGNLENVGRNRYSGGTESELSTRWQWKDNTVYTREMWRGEMLTTFLWVEAIYIWLKPGYGLDFVQFDVNQSLETCYLWYEFPSTEV